MFSIHDFIMSAIKGMVGRYPDFQVREYSLNWYSKGKLTEEDLATVEEWLTPVVDEAADAPEEGLADVPEEAE
ncbi:MAG: hypothetical protein IKF39_01680 [Oscillospiraceae bacterium]|nr:hypothetical protein [Oscillospiraceae bacterium]